MIFQRLALLLRLVLFEITAPVNCYCPRGDYLCVLGKLEIILAAQALLVIYDALGLIPGLYLPYMVVSAIGVFPM